jgi:hypothetical protein
MFSIKTNLEDLDANVAFALDPQDDRPYADSRINASAESTQCLSERTLRSNDARVCAPDQPPRGLWAGEGYRRP